VNMARDELRTDDAASDEAWWRSDRPVAKKDLPAGVVPSTAGGGRGNVNPSLPIASEPAALGDPMGGGFAEIEQAGTRPFRQTGLERAIANIPIYDEAELIRQSRRQGPAPQPRAEALTDARVAEPYRATPKRGFFRAAADTSLALEQGLFGVAKGVADNVNAGNNPVSRHFAGAIRGAELLKSPESRELISRRAGRIQTVQANQGERAAARVAFQTLLDSPVLAIDALAQGTGSALPTLLMGPAGASPRLLTVVNGVSNAGTSASDAADKLRALPPSAWSEDPAYRALREQGLMDHKDAVNTLAPIYALPAQAMGGVAGAIPGPSGAARNAIGDRVARFAAEPAKKFFETVAPGVAGNLVVGAVDGKTGAFDGMGQKSVDAMVGTLGPAVLAAKSGGASNGAARQSAAGLARSKGFLQPVVVKPRANAESATGAPPSPEVAATPAAGLPANQPPQGPLARLAASTDVGGPGVVVQEQTPAARPTPVVEQATVVAAPAPVAAEQRGQSGPTDGRATGSDATVAAVARGVDANLNAQTAAESGITAPQEAVPTNAGGGASRDSLRRDTPRVLADSPAEPPQPVVPGIASTESAHGGNVENAGVVNRAGTEGIAGTQALRSAPSVNEGMPQAAKEPALAQRAGEARSYVAQPGREIGESASIAREAQDPSRILPGDILNRKGKPFTVRLPAIKAAKKAGEGHEVVPVGNGFVVRRSAIQPGAENRVVEVNPEPASATRRLED